MSDTSKLILKKANLEDIIKEVEFIKQVPLLENGFANFFYNVLHKSNEEIINYVLTLSYTKELIPIYTYFLHCWLEFLTEKRHWNQIRSICLGICFAIIIWVKYTLIYFVIIPMIILP